MIETKRDNLCHVGLGDFTAPIISNVRLGGTVDNNITSKAVHIEAGADVGDE